MVGKGAEWGGDHMCDQLSNMPEQEWNTTLHATNNRLHTGQVQGSTGHDRTWRGAPSPNPAQQGRSRVGQGHGKGQGTCRQAGILHGGWGMGVPHDSHQHPDLQTRLSRFRARLHRFLDTTSKRVELEIKKASHLAKAWLFLEMAQENKEPLANKEPH